MLLANRQHFVDEVLYGMEWIDSNGRHCETVGYRREAGREDGFAHFEGSKKGRAGFGDQSDDPRSRRQRPRRYGNSGEKSSTTAWNQQRVHVVHLLEDLDAHRSGASEDIQMIVSIDVLAVVVFGQLQRDLTRDGDVFALNE